jgi:rhodanese-related sulfurtransferase
MRWRFPQVAQLPPAALALWLDDFKRTQPVLLDVRKEMEYAVSHLPGAQRIDPQATAADVIKKLPSGRPVVVYCAVGYRSSKLAQRLVEAGVSDVFNLKGSIFSWASEGRALQSDRGPVSCVHPCNALWGRLLAKHLRSTCTE